MKGERVKRLGKRVMNWSKYKPICSSCSQITNYSGDKNAIDEYFEPQWWRQELLKLLSILPLFSIILKVGSMRTKVLSERSFSHINFFLLFYYSHEDDNDDDSSAHHVLRHPIDFLVFWVSNLLFSHTQLHCCFCFSLLHSCK